MTPEIYRRVCEARPELAVRHWHSPSWVLGVGTIIPYGFQWKDVGMCQQLISDPIAHALILAHWLKMLPLGVGVWTCGGRFPSENWNCGHVKDPTATPCRQNVLDAIAEHFVPGSTKGAE